MPFEFLKYLQPTHYFRLINENGESVFPKTESLPKAILENLESDSGYDSTQASDYDLSWQAICNGYIGETENYTHFETVSRADNYRFCRKYFHGAWVFYVLLIRVLNFYNPINEFSAYMKTRGVARVPVGKTPIEYDTYHRFQSQVLEQKPLVSVVIPTLNRYDYLKAVLVDLEQQDYSHFEVIVVDQSDNFHAAFYDDFNLNFKIIKQKEKALWLARNTAIKQAKGAIIALSEDDVRINPDWISSHLKCLDYFKAQVSAGVFYPKGQSIPKSRSFFMLASQFATGNAVLYRSVFNQLGLFDRQFEKQRMGDAEFGMRVYLAGIKSVSNPYASCIDVKASTGGLRELGSWDAFRPSTFFAPRPIPSVLYYFRRYFGNTASRYSLLRSIPVSIVPYQFKKSRVLLMIGTFVSLFLTPIITYQVFKSWRLSSKKLQEGPLIDRL